VTICVQGSIDKIQGNTYFGKKHLLTFYGGKTNTQFPNLTYAEGVAYKANKIINRRIYGPRKGYSNTPLYEGDPCTFIMCDYLAPDELRGAFAKALKNAVRYGEKQALIWFEGRKCVATVTNGNWEFAEHCTVGYKVSSDNSTFSVIHLDACYNYT